MYASRFNLVFPLDKSGDCVVINALAGSIDLMDQRELRVLRDLETEGHSDPGSEFEIKGFIERGYVYSSEEDELRQLEKLHSLWKKEVAQDPGQFFIIPSYACNLRCVYCFQDATLRKPEVMRKDIAGKALDAIQHLCQKRGSIGSPEVVLFGGEPLLRNPRQTETVLHIIGECKERGFRTKIITNGVNLEYYCNRFDFSGVGWIQVTLDGPKEIHDRRRMFANGTGSFKWIEKGVDKALDCGLKVALRVNVDMQNIEGLPEFAEFIVEKGWVDSGQLVSYIGPVREICSGYKHLAPAHEILRSILELYITDEQTRVLSLLGWRGIDALRHLLRYGRLPPPQFDFCGANTSRLCLDVGGDIYTCVTIAGMKEHRVGRFHPLLEIDEDRLAAWRSRDILSMPQCSRCKWSLMCGGGCSFLALVSKGSFHQPYCFHIEEILRLGIDYFVPFMEDSPQSLA